jgi:L-amino acid N-acyltransferase YncA
MQKGGFRAAFFVEFVLYVRQGRIMNHLLREARTTDLGAIAEIYRDAVENGVSSYELIAPGAGEMRRRFEAMTARDYPYFVAEDRQGRVLGYAYAGPHRPRPAYRWTVENAIYIDREARGQGLGRALLTELIARCESLGFRQMVAVIGGPEPASVALHAALGFDHIGTMRATGYKFGRWLDTAVMQRALGDGREKDPDEGSYPGTLFPGR